MSSPDRSLLADLKAELSGLKANLGEMLQLRWELARLEIQADIGHLKRLAFIWGVAAVMALTSLPLLATCVADVLDGRLGIARRGWLLIFGLALLCTAFICVYLGRIWFRRRFVGLQQTLEELREDLEWVKEKMKGEG
ncbi:MAG: phage holin family protein [Thermoguttaceae bacterium]|jgi:peptidoglycan biosynthesis protein MviN/MurJ (putative lipid II flippase)